MLRLETKVGSSIEFTDAVFKEAEKELLKRPEVESYSATSAATSPIAGRLCSL